MHTPVLDSRPPVKHLQVIKLRVTTYALRCIDKAGGLDQYIMGLKKVEPGTKEHELKERIKAARSERLEIEASAAVATHQ